MFPRTNQNFISKYESLRDNVETKLSTGDQLVIKNLGEILASNNEADLFTMLCCFLEQGLSKPILELFNLLLQAEELSDPHGSLHTAFSYLKRNGILTREHFSALIQHNAPFDLARGLRVLHVADMLELYRDICIKHPHPLDLASSLAELPECQDALRAKLCDMLSQAQNPLSLGEAFYLLLKEEVQITDELLDILAKNQNPDLFVGAFLALVSSGIEPTEKILGSLSQHHDLGCLANILAYAKQVLSPDNIIGLISHKNPKNLDSIFFLLSKFDCLDRESFESVCTNIHSSKYLAEILLLLSKSKMTLDKNVFHAAITCHNHEKLYEALRNAKSLKKLTEEEVYAATSSIPSPEGALFGSHAMIFHSSDGKQELKESCTKDMYLHPCH